MSAQGSTRDEVATAAAGAVLLTLASAQFLMTLDSSVMNVSMATVANDVGTTITGIQTAITLYTLVMATLMITGGKIGTLIGRRRAFSIGCVVYGLGSFVTGLAPNLTVLIIGWSFLEGIGAALIMPAIVALVAGNFEPSARPRAYGLVAAAGAIAVAVGPLVGGAATTYLSWRVVFFSEVLVVLVILVLSRRIKDIPTRATGRIDLVGTLLSVVGLGTAVYGILRSSEWGWIAPKPGATAILGLSMTFWFVVVGAFVVWLFVLWETRLEQNGGDPLVRPTMLANPQLVGGLLMFFFQFLLQAGTFFIVPLFLSVVLELPAVETGLKIMPLSVALLLAAAGIPRRWPHASPRRVSRIGVILMLLGIVVLMSGIRLDASAAVVAVPMVLIGLGIGALSSQLGAVTVSAVPTEESGEVGGLQNTATNLGASLGTALAGSVLITVLTTSLIAGIQDNPDVPEQVRSQASVQLASGVPFLSDTALESALTEAGVDPTTTQAVVQENQVARVDGLDSALATLAILAVVSLFFTGRIPREPPGATAPDATPDPTTAEPV
ncbi:MFS transporter [Cellulomonas soli]|uniref:MFS transporter n=1 Tax=Cellulomonas soli TaxID=931535 RepID=A0A512PBW4_9CELL|nr:MFS transporter [Cellulomonas soli]NYI58277.1 EmrB/QacA subfamily drug resistance transporter [Cellulomonas soli]GEP68697.1 MFS transporter [Cellulomonas soli]